MALLRLTEVLTTAVEVLTKVPPSAGKKSKAKEDQPQVERASTLDYKHVDEAYVVMSWERIAADPWNSWDDKSGKYKIVGSTDSETDEFCQYVFVVRNRIGESASSTDVRGC
jgi:hypothetical protein